MDASSELALIGSLQQHRLGLTSLLSDPSGAGLSLKQYEMATNNDPGEPTDTRVSHAVQLAWAMAMQAQSCAYLALMLQQYAEILSVSQITCPESTFNRLLGSVEIFTRLLDSMRQNYAECSSSEYANYIPVLSERMVAAIRSTLDQEPVTTTVGSTISTEKAKEMSTEPAGDTR